MKKTILAHWMGLDSLCISAYWETHLIGCPAIQMLHLVGTNSRLIFRWPLDSDRQIFVLPQDSLLVSTICWPSPSRVWVLLKVFSGIIWLPHIIHNYPSTIKNTTKDHTQDMAKINVWPGCKWYQATWSARLLINFQFFLQFPRRVVALHQLSKVTRAMMLKTSTTIAVNISICKLNTEIRVVLKIFWWVHCRCSRPGWPLHRWACSYFL